MLVTPLIRPGEEPSLSPVLDVARTACQIAPMTTELQNPVGFSSAVELLKSGEICAFPTETVYGLGADASDASAVLKIYQTKERPSFNPLIIHCADMGMAEEIASFSAVARHLASMWPGALTLVLPKLRQATICDLVTAGLHTVGVRVPAHPLAQKLIRAVGRPLAAPSANPSGRLSPTSAGQVRHAFADKVAVLDGGNCSSGLESTILGVEGQRVVQLRSGALTREEIQIHLGREIEVVPPNAAISAPGMMASHYAPNAKIRLNATEAGSGEAFLGFGDVSGSGPMAKNLSQKGDLAEAAHNLFGFLHELDATGAARIAVAPIPSTGLGEAINDRLSRASAPGE